ncbi:MAG: aldo/keto reductase [Desulfocapsaceae bacterium]
MNYRNMGKSGLKVSEVCFGTMTFGHGTDEPEANAMVDLCFDAGINFFDTADGYQVGASEIMLGKALKGRRREAVIATKFFNPMGPGPNDSGMSRVHIMQSIEDSLKRLQTDYVDIYYIHHVEEQTPLEEMLWALDDLVRQGKVRYTACSNYQAWRLATALGISKAEGWAQFSCYQPQYNLVVRDIEQELIPLCDYHGLGVVTWGPLAGGLLSGKYVPGERQMSGTRSEEGWVFLEDFFADNADETLAALLDVAAKMKKTPAQIAIRWVLDQPVITSVIVGARTKEQLQDNIKVSGWSIPAEYKAGLDKVSYLPDRYPEKMEKHLQQRRDDALDMPSLE